MHSRLEKRFVHLKCVRSNCIKCKTQEIELYISVDSSFILDPPDFYDIWSLFMEASTFIFSGI